MISRESVNNPESWVDKVGDMLHAYNAKNSHRITKLPPDIIFFVSGTQSKEEALKNGLAVGCYDLWSSRYANHASLVIDCEIEVLVLTELTLLNCHLNKLSIC